MPECSTAEIDEYLSLNSCPDGKQIITMKIASVLVTFLMSEEQCRAFILQRKGIVTDGWGVLEGEWSWGSACLCVISDSAIYLLGNSGELLSPSQSPILIC